MIFCHIFTIEYRSLKREYSEYPFRWIFFGVASKIACPVVSPEIRQSIGSQRTSKINTHRNQAISNERSFVNHFGSIINVSCDDRRACKWLNCRGRPQVGLGDSTNDDSMYLKKIIHRLGH